MSQALEIGDNKIIVTHDKLDRGTWYTVYAYRYFSDMDKHYWVVTAEGTYEGMLGNEYCFVTEKKDRSGYVWDLRTDRVNKETAIHDNYKFVTRKV